MPASLLDSRQSHEQLQHLWIVGGAQTSDRVPAHSGGESLGDTNLRVRADWGSPAAHAAADSHVP